MGVARLLAKCWVVFCLFAGAHGLSLALSQGAPPAQALEAIGLCLALFGAMGLLFIAGFGASATGSTPLLSRVKPRHLIPSFDDVVFVAFVALSFAAQIYFVSEAGNSAAGQALQKAMYFAVPGLPALSAKLAACGLNAPRLYSVTLAFAVAWLLAIVFVASALSRVRLTAGLIRLERALHPAIFGPTVLAVLYFVVAIVGIQLLYIGSLYPWLGCNAFGGIDGVVLTGLAPLLLAYVVVAALVTLKASAPED
jgi:hypothetical protein